MSAGFFTTCERLLSATANGVYQGVLVALLAGLTLRLFARTNAATRHAVWFGVLLFVTALIPAHLLLSCLPRPEIPSAASQSASTVSTMSTGTPALPDAGDSTGSPAAETSIPDSRMEAADAEGIEVASYPPAAGLRSESAGIGSPVTPVTVKPWWRSALATIKPLFWNLETSIHLPHSVCICLVSIWVLLATIRGALIARQIVEVRRVKTTSGAPNDGLQTRFDQLRDSLGTTREVRLRLSDTHRTAVVLGFVHPVVLLPAEMGSEAPDGEVEDVLRHELAHVDRRDDWGNLTQQVIQAALFFHPAVWWISARLSLEREIACDDHVLEASGQPRDYALTLANMAGRMIPCRHLLAPGVSNNHSQLQQRISMILNTHRDRSTRLARSRVGFLTTTTAILAVLAIGAGPRLVLAQSLPAPTPSPAPEAVVVADTAPVVLPDRPGVESGPRIKVDSSDANDAPEVPEPPAPAIPAVPPVPALAPDAPVPPVGMMPPAPRAARPRHAPASIEARLDRIERTLEELQSRDGGKVHRRGGDDAPPRGSVELDAPGSMALNFNGDRDFKRMAEEARRMAEEARRAAEDGKRAAEDGKRDAEKAMRDLVKLKSKDFERLQEQLSEVESEAPMQALEALRSAHESLERQMQSIERQIKHLEENQDRRNKRGKGRTEAPEEGPKPGQPGEPAK